MTRVAVSILGSEDLSDHAFRRAVAKLTLRTEVMAIGPVVRGESAAAMAAILRVEEGLLELAAILDRLTNQDERGEFSFHLLTYGSAIYRSENLNVPPDGLPGMTSVLDSLSKADPNFEIPGLGSVIAHLEPLQHRR